MIYIDSPDSPVEDLIYIEDKLRIEIEGIKNCLYFLDPKDTLAIYNTTEAYVENEYVMIK